MKINKLAVIGGLVLLTVIGWFSWVLFSTPPVMPVELAAKPVLPNVVSFPVPDATHVKVELAQFMTEILSPKLSMIGADHYDVPMVEQMIVSVRQGVNERHQTGNINIQLHGSLSVDQESFLRESVNRADVAMCACVDDSGNPVVKVNAPLYLGIYNDFRASGKDRWEEAFDNTLVAGFLHECYHLAYSPIDLCGHPLKITAEEVIAEELRIYGLVCQNVTGPMIQAGLPLADWEVRNFNKWSACGGNQACWREAMGYSSLRGS